ncbi:hypothetical protein J8273_1346 [Carpediemonas membranifera]|uniref:Uncharacterized protein n=1 Tax=Carpediemonas membranifera TaxID=201153 RepID=A0A8J6E6D9_9EUKA|nr:hypothetical protein J8273_1346 [Carpediemonas membranifera]|eukprot:KAG9396997.1 hypothetical protein J8273_1346 [Carpediemonas membranifera]
MRRRTSGIILRRGPARLQFAGRPRDEKGKYAKVQNAEGSVPITLPPSSTNEPSEPEPETVSERPGLMPLITHPSDMPQPDSTPPPPQTGRRGRRGGARRRCARNLGTATRGPPGESSAGTGGQTGNEAGATFGRAMSMVELCNKLLC